MANPSFLRKKKLGYFSKTVFMANILAVLALLLSYCASFIDPRDFWIIAFFGLAYAPILLINGGFIIYWLLRKKRNALLSLSAILIGWSFLNNHINFKNKNDKILVKTDTTIRVMSFNVHLFQQYDNKKNKFRDETVEFIRTINPDVVCFQEFYSRIRGSKQFTKALQEEGEFEDFYFEPFEKNDYEGYGQAIFSKYPIIHYGTIEENSFGVNRIIFADVKRETDTLRIYNVHLRSFALQEEDKDFIQKSPSEQVKDEEQTKKLGRKLKRAFTSRSNQARTLVKHISKCPYPYVVMGDFNDTPMSYSVNLLSKNMNNAFAEKGFGWGVTYFGILPIFQIDYIMSDKRIKIDDYGILKERLSDHYPIWADLIY
ncbi:MULTISPECIES: endonuclease/exonuclease/phosphatase family protein [Sphingobacterium]|uniref:Endonuclease/exonuclease/phosphatase family protein n=1 Tax=Sphingobacterium litopenaei TaxID=2763500 RepID=A0ABR7YE51_9SPHI|nr:MULTISPECIES: endonuclease/exonuclease/phosphatase family protein [Sphingobacterium]MBD1429556.1 endonuclease/exonuclease/phosphatase family protein [Sphingobacterium litopenaei]NGM72733.1 endonuclease/exonuclease/phosphatase family protein [Sphingobacterium sp. SGL-16]